MIALRTMFKSDIKRLVTNCVRFASQTSHSSNSKIYEIRKYAIKPAHYAEFIKLTTEHFHLRTAHSKVVGYFGGEIGSINQTIHVWEYDNYAHRTEVRAKLAKDPDWLATYISKLVQYVEKQENHSGVLPEWCQLNEVTNKKNGVYELNTFDMKPGVLLNVNETLKKMLLCKGMMSYCDLIGVWYPDIGEKNRVSVIWRYNSLDGRREGNEKLLNDSTYRDSAVRISDATVGENSIVMTPFAWSPMQ